MLKVSLSIPEIKTDIELFFVDAPKHLNREVAQALHGEINFNKMEYTFGGLIERK